MAINPLTWRLSRSGRLTIILAAAAYLSFIRIGQYDLQEWDESRNGLNAIEMLQSGDPINFYFNGKLDTWNAKPPLAIWSICLSYKIFGHNAFALRLPSALCAIAFFLVLFLMIEKFHSGQLSFLTCMILLSCKAIFGNHIALTGDFDMMLVLWLTFSAYFFFLSFSGRGTLPVILFSISTGLAFYTKGPAGLLLLPGMLAFLMINKRWKAFLRPSSLLGVIVLAGIVASWIWISKTLGGHTVDSIYGSKSAMETLFVHDVFRRFFDTDFQDPTGGPDYFFVFKALDSRMNLWNYVLYGVITYTLIQRRAEIIDLFSRRRDSFPVFAACLIVPVLILMTIAISKHNWYLAPIFPFIAFLTTVGVAAAAARYRVVQVTISFLLLFTLSREVVFVSTLPTKKNDSIKSNLNVLAGSLICCREQPSQDLRLYMKWANMRLVNDPFRRVDWILQNTNESLSSKCKIDISYDERQRLCLKY